VSVPSPALRAEGLLCAFDAPRAAVGFTLRIPRFQVARGESVALVGPSGCGKTTLLRALAGLHVPRDGAIDVGGFALRGPAARDVTEASRRRHRLEHIGLVSQEPGLIDYLSVRDNLLLAWHLGATPSPWPDALERARTLADALGIAAHLSKRPAALSQGERQRVAVGRALAPRPRVVLADEPTGSLDAAAAVRVMDLLLEPVRRDGAALLCVTHDLSLVPRFDRVVDLLALRESAA
jgi:putative ABC transport system ATP-binding protein